MDNRDKLAIRDYLGHNGVECVVRIKHNGEVHRKGNPVETNRSRDTWQFMGMADEILKQINSWSWES